MVHNFFDTLYDKLLDQKNQVACGTGMLYGWILSIYTLLQSSGLGVVVSWEFIIKTFAGIIISVITTVAILLTTDFYKYSKPKVKRFSNKYLQLKCFKNGNKKTKNKTAA